MFHVDPAAAAPEQMPDLDSIPLFVNIPMPIRTEADLERAELQDEAA